MKIIDLTAILSDRSSFYSGPGSGSETISFCFSIGTYGTESVVGCIDVRVGRSFSSVGVGVEFRVHSPVFIEKGRV